MTAREFLTGWLSGCCVALVGGAAAATTPDAQPERRNAVAIFGGVMTNEDWQNLFLEPHDIAFESAGLFGVAVSRRVARPFEGLDVEIEAQLVRHFGDQTHWEANLPIATARWTRFPWDESVDTSAAFGLGMSFASEKPELEIDFEGDTRAIMPYWMIEIALGEPDADWEVIGRVHHRSSAFGAFGDDGGSNALTLGLRRRF